MMRVSPPQKRRSAHKQIPSAPFFFPLTLPTMASQTPIISYREMVRNVTSGNCHALAFTFETYPELVDALFIKMMRKQPSRSEKLIQQTTDYILPTLAAVQRFKEQAANDQMAMAAAVKLERDVQAKRRLLKAKQHAATRPYYEAPKGPFTLDLPD